MKHIYYLLYGKNVSKGSSKPEEYEIVTPNEIKPEDIKKNLWDFLTFYNDKYDNIFENKDFVKVLVPFFEQIKPDVSTDIHKGNYMKNFPDLAKELGKHNVNKIKKNIKDAQELDPILKKITPMKTSTPTEEDFV